MDEKYSTTESHKVYKIHSKIQDNSCGGLSMESIAEVEKREIAEASETLCDIHSAVGRQLEALAGDPESLKSVLMTAKDQGMTILDIYFHFLEIIKYRLSEDPRTKDLPNTWMSH